MAMNGGWLMTLLYQSINDIMGMEPTVAPWNQLATRSFWEIKSHESREVLLLNAIWNVQNCHKYITLYNYIAINFSIQTIVSACASPCCRCFFPSSSPCPSVSHRPFSCSRGRGQRWSCFVALVALGPIPAFHTKPGEKWSCILQWIFPLKWWFSTVMLHYQNY